MENKVISEIRGTIVKIINHDGRKSGFIMQPDDLDSPKVTYANDLRDYSKFDIGQRVVSVKFVMCNPSNDDEMKKYNELRKRQMLSWKLLCDEKLYDEYVNGNENMVVDEVHGTIAEVWTNGKGIIIRPDNPDIGSISEVIGGDDHSQFHVGQRVVCVTYVRLRLPTLNEIEGNFPYLPDIVRDYHYVTYDELSYDVINKSKGRN